MAVRHGGERKRAPGAGRPRKTPRRSDAPVAEEIVAEASRLFARQGVAATTMADIAGAAGLQVSSLYYYFRSKHEILETIVGEVNRLPRAALAEARATHADPATALHAFIRSDAAVLCRFPFDINEIHRLAGDDDDSDFGRYWAERQQLHDDVEQLVADGIASGDLIEVDPQLTALTILADDEAAQNWFRPVGARRLMGRGGSTERYTPEAVGAFLADFTLRALLRDPSRLASIRTATDG